MRRLLFAVVVTFVFALPSMAFANWEHSMPIRQPGNVGLGLGAGTFATGLSLKYFASPDVAIQGNVGWWRSRWFCSDGRCYGGGDSLALSADFLLEQPTIAGNGDLELAWNFGLGAGLGIDENANDIGLGMSGVLGIEFLINVIPIDLVIEYRPNILVVPDVHIDLIDFAGHVRFYF